VRIIIGVLVVVGLAGIACLVLYLDYGTVAPCGILRERVRQEVVREGGQLGSFVATAMPDNVLDGLIASQYGALSPGHCVSLLFKGEPKELRVTVPPPGQQK